MSQAARASAFLALLLLANAEESCFGCNVDLSRRGCVAAAQGEPLPVYIYPTPFPYVPQQINMYLFHLMNWLPLQGSRSNSPARQVTDPEVRSA